LRVGVAGRGVVGQQSKALAVAAIHLEFADVQKGAVALVRFGELFFLNEPSECPDSSWLVKYIFLKSPARVKRFRVTFLKRNGQPHF